MSSASCQCRLVLYKLGICPALIALLLVTVSRASPFSGSHSNHVESQQERWFHCQVNLASGVLYGLYTLDQILKQNPSQFNNPNALLQGLSLKLGKGSFDDLVLSKTLCGTMIVSVKAMTRLLEEIDIPNAKALFFGISLIPAVYSRNEVFDYDNADLPTTLTLFSTKTSAKLLEHCVQGYVSDNATSGVVILAVAFTLWLIATSNEKTGAVATFFWIAVPKLFMSAGLSQLYKATGKGHSFGSLYSGLIWYQVGSLISEGVSHNALPVFSGLTECFAGKSRKLLGYGFADAINQVVTKSPLPNELKKMFSYTLVYQLGSYVDGLSGQMPGNALLKSLRRGMVVRVALFKIELALQAGEMLSHLIDPQLGVIQKTAHLADDELMPNAKDHCIRVPAHGMATSVYAHSCYAVKGSEASVSINTQDLEWLIFLFIL